MRTLTLIIVATGLMAMTPAPEVDCCGIPSERAVNMSEADWQAYTDRVFDALTQPIFTDAALRAVIQYGDRLAADRGDVISLVRVYRDGEVLGHRRMAVIGINSLDDAWGIDFLSRSYQFEKDQVLKYTVAAVLADYNERHREGTVEVGPLNVVSPV
ncbi:MAG: hypothetical protein HKN29_07390, partial [Rhodothermales bacterium]|nr:hypothetical protein [Rhodothermales bacterium]